MYCAFSLTTTTFGDDDFPIRCNRMDGLRGIDDRNRTLAPLSTTVVDSQRRTTKDENIWITEGLLLRKDRSLGHAAKSLMVRTQ